MTVGRPNHRLFYIDNLRWSAINMVVIMHAAVTYSPFGAWYYREHPELNLDAKIAFAAYQSFQHAVAMGLLFGIAGYFAAGAVARKGTEGFIHERLKRLGLPLLLYMTVIGPLTEYFVAGSWQSKPPRPFLQDWWLHLRSGELLSESGPLWFCLVLLLFSAAYAGLCRVRPTRLAPRPPPSVAMVLGYAGLIAIVTFTVGVAFPNAGTVLNVDVHDFPQYPLMYAAGITAWKADWLRQIPSHVGRRWLWAGIAAGGALWALLVAAGGALTGDLSAYGSGWHWQAAGIDTWRSFTCLTLSLGLIILYRDCFNAQGPVSRFLTRNAFGVYVLHAPILIAITRLLHILPASIGVKFALASICGVAISFLFVGLVARRMPGLRAVL
ncbi:Acyltransferase family protein [Enhydrobacter aerosaccus]|uniref:Acyltransferase family protein n=1 Tax=Enhydrobacter aerosaccus TaxID=225324 RepID=A0A1T4PCY5_9HYPH|nr:acyltransferase [Enhydrobacter aerosaccus]SJZ89187.1 Acyltransferase family protein [Enhydrobacter aerosaccus]